MIGLVVVPLLMLVSTLTPSKQWFAPGQPLTVQVEAEGAVRLRLNEFRGSEREGVSDEAAIVEGGTTVNLLEIFPQALAEPGAYVLRTTAVEEAGRGFVGTPLVIEIREDTRDGAPLGPMIVRVVPLRYAVIRTSHGPIEAIFYYDVAPHTVANFLHLAEEGFYDGLTFHRIVPQFLIQGGDPRGDGSGGPGYSIPGEFNERPHLEGVLSMARQGDPNEASGAAPRPQFANSAGSQFFICLDYSRTRALDGRYSAFGEVVSGMDAVRAIADVEIENPTTGRPAQPQQILSIEVKPVTPEHNPYDVLIQAFESGTAKPQAADDEATTQPAEKPGVLGND